MTVQGQYDFMEDFLNRISHIKGNRGKGFFYWEPRMDPGSGFRLGNGSILKIYER